MEIKKLPDITISKISAGEVILDPASVVKELLENSIDANSTEIEIAILKGGKELIQVKDNGDGMKKENLEVCFKKHTTSKIKDFSDITNTITLGFRGEGLFSIASVSDVQIISKSKGSKEFEAGYCLKLKDLDIKDLKKTASNYGTRVEIKDLFYNLKPRLENLENNRKEFKKIYNVVLNYALVYENVEFKLTHDNKTYLNTKNLSTRKDRILNFLDYKKEELFELNIDTNSIKNETFKDLQSINQAKDPYIKGFLIKPNRTYPNSNNQFIFVNNRPILNSKISKTVKEAYSNLIDPKSYPAFLIYINVPQKDLDINIHPTKRKVKFFKEDKLIKQIFELFKKTLEENNLVFQKQNRYTDFEKDEYSHLSDNVKEYKTDWSLEKETATYLNNIIQLDNLYLVVRTKNSLIMIDQHAAHEKILYEQYKEAHIKRETNTKKTNINLNVTDIQKEDIKENLEFFKNIGFEVDDINSKETKFITIPSQIDEVNVNNVVKEYLQDLEDNITGQQFIKNKTDKMLKYIACRSAIKAGDFLTEEKRKKLVEKTFKDIKTTYTCPHGRPVLVEIKLPEIEKMFKRK